ncbi:MAG TPA: DNA helicase RecQ [Anaerolineales bacterium]|nr:DNA helicase RecQ [Anaerolineales bacterium]
MDKQPTAHSLRGDLEKTLRDVFGYMAFRPLQREIIHSVLDGRHTLAVMPTGSGKSLCYQLPALLRAGPTVVVSPLIALMEDQVLQLREWGIPAVYLNSSLDYRAYLNAAHTVRTGKVRLVYAAPETLVRPDMAVLLNDAGAECFVIDEAHCISEWGHDFRPEYRRLAEIRDRLPEMGTLAVTATATGRVRDDIIETLGVPDAGVFIGSFDRPNLHLSVRDKYDGFRQALEFLNAHKDQAGIIYCSTRDSVDALSAELAELGFPALPYHAGMSTDDRRRNQHRFRYEDAMIIVATIAFGMGIDKPDVRFILHYNLPKNLESYYQQIGRAGRDGLPADCLLLYSYSDVSTIRYFFPADDPIRRRGEEVRLQTFLGFVEATGCRRPPLLRYFGEDYPVDRCGNCDRCDLETARTASAASTGDRDTAEAQQDLSEPARLFLSTARLTGEVFGAAHLIDVLAGSRGKRIIEKKHDRLKTYGAGNGYTKEAWRILSGMFIREGLLRRTPPHGSLVITAEGKAVLDGKTFMTAVAEGIARPLGSGPAAGYDQGLFSQLRLLRTRLAEELSVPPYVVFQDRTLMEMAARLPQTAEALGEVFGVGKTKLEHYGDQFLEMIAAYCREHELKPSQAAPVQPAARPPAQSLTGVRRTREIWSQYREGRPIPEIAAGLSFTTGTILEHLEKALEMDLDMDPEGLVRFSALDPAAGDRIRAAFTELGTRYLKPVFESLGETISYEELKLWRLILAVEEKQNA